MGVLEVTSLVLKLMPSYWCLRRSGTKFGIGDVQKDDFVVVLGFHNLGTRSQHQKEKMHSYTRIWRLASYPRGRERSSDGLANNYNHSQH